MEGGWSVRLPAVAGGGRRRPEVAGDRWPKPPSPNNDGATLVEMVKTEFWKRSFGERSYTLLERVFRGEKDGVVRGG